MHECPHCGAGFVGCGDLLVIGAAKSNGTKDTLYNNKSTYTGIYIRDFIVRTITIRYSTALTSGWLVDFVLAK